MNPQDQPQQQPSEQPTSYAPNPQPSKPIQTYTDPNVEAFETINTIEAEDTATNTTVLAADETPTVPVAPITSAEPIANTATYTSTESPVTVIAPKKSSKLLLVVAIAAFILTAGVAGFIVWESIQGDASQPAVTDQQTGGDLPGGDDTPAN